MVWQVEIPQPEMRRTLQRSSEGEVWPLREPLDQSGSNDFSAYEEIQDLKDACAVFRYACLITYSSSCTLHGMTCPGPTIYKTLLPSKCNTHIMLCNVSLHHPEACPFEDGYLLLRWQLQ